MSVNWTRHFLFVRCPERRDCSFPATHFIEIVNGARVEQSAHTKHYKWPRFATRSMRPWCTYIYSSPIPLPCTLSPPQINYNMLIRFWTIYSHRPQFSGKMFISWEPESRRVNVLLVLVITVILGFESLGTHDHIIIWRGEEPACGL